jgi:hypothetical protein
MNTIPRCYVTQSARGTYWVVATDEACSFGPFPMESLAQAKADEVNASWAKFYA